MTTREAIAQIGELTLFEAVRYAEAIAAEDPALAQRVASSLLQVARQYGEAKLSEKGPHDRIVR